MSSNVLVLPSRAMQWRSIRTLDGQTVNLAGFTSPENGAIWEWVQDYVASELGCRPDDVQLRETEEGVDLLTVDGMPAFILSRGC